MMSMISNSSSTFAKSMDNKRLSTQITQPSLGDFGCIEPTDDDCLELPDDIAVNLLIENASCNVGSMQVENLIFDLAVMHSEAEMRQQERDYKTIKWTKKSQQPLPETLQPANQEAI